MPHRLLALPALLCLLLAGLAHGADPAVAPAASGPVDLAELPHWPIGLALPASLADPMAKAPKGGPKAAILAWLPEALPRLKGMVLIVQNSDSKEFGQHPALREACGRAGLGIVYLRFGLHQRLGDGGRDTTAIDAVFGALAEATGRAGFQHAPWITFGKSASGKFPFTMAWAQPQRTIAGITYHGEVPTWPAPAWARLGGESIPYVCANGESEWDGTWFRHARPGLLNYRERQGWLTQQVVAHGVGHGDYVDGVGSEGFGKPFPGKMTVQRVWDYLTRYVETMTALRLPPDADPADGPVALRSLDDSQGYLIEHHAIERMFQVPELPLQRSADGDWQLGNAASASAPPVSGYARIAPLPADAVVEQAVAPLKLGVSPVPVLLAPFRFAMFDDPMLEAGALLQLNPKAGDTVSIEDKTATFALSTDKQHAKEGGIALNTGLRPPNGKITLISSAVVAVDQPMRVQVGAGFTAAVRVQMSVNGNPVRHLQVLDLAPGRYRLLTVMRITANWSRIAPSLNAVTPELVTQAQAVQAELDAVAAEQARLAAASAVAAPAIFRRADSVSAAERRQYQWLPNRAMAEAWLELHRVKPGRDIVIP
jgi:hypothetical protein